MSESGASVLLPPGTRLLHIGPHKTGTTAVQNAFHLARRAVTAQGVHYAGRHAQPMSAAYAVLGIAPYYAKPTPISRWEDLVDEIDAAGQRRSVISSEGFCDADEAAIERIARDLDGSRIHVLITLRPLATILPSQYQQFVQGGLQLAFDPWLDAMLLQPPGAVSPQFWRRHRHDELIERWASIVGRDRVTAVVADAGEPRVVLGLFERMVGLREGTLVPESHHANRSLTRGEIELVRALNRVLGGVDIGPMIRNKLMRLGTTEMIKRRSPGREEPRLELPDWARDRAAEIARTIVEGIKASGVRVIGDVESLAAAGQPRSAKDAAADAEAAADAWPRMATTAAMGVLITTGLARSDTNGAGTEPWPDQGARGASAARPAAHPEPRAVDVESEVSAMPTGHLASIFLARARTVVAPRVQPAARVVRWVRRRRASGSDDDASIHSPSVEVE